MSFCPRPHQSNASGGNKDNDMDEMLFLVFLKNLFNKNLLSLEVSIGKPFLYVKEILPQNVVLDADDRSGGKLRHYSL
jgi:hypothetical protein